MSKKIIVDILFVLLIAIALFFSFGLFNRAEAQSYCPSCSQDASYEGIVRVRLDTGDNSSSRTECSDYSGSSFTTMQAGASYNLYVTGQTTGWFGDPEYVKAWIDFNHNGNFNDSGEELDLGSRRFNGIFDFSKTFTVPSSAVLGDTRMRVILKYQSAPSPCDNNYSYGETEDYTVNIETVSLPPQISVTPLSLNFGDVDIGLYSNFDFTVENIGEGTLSGSVSGLAAPFSCQIGCSYGLGAGESQITTIRFAPSSAGIFTDTAIFSGGGGSSNNVSGNGVPAPVFYETFPNADSAWNGSSDTAQQEAGWSVYQGPSDSNDVQVSNEDSGNGTLPPSGGSHLTFDDCDEGFQTPEMYDMAYVPIDLSSYEDVVIEYYWQSDDVDSGEGLKVAYSIDSTNGRDGTWVQIASHINPTDDRWYLESFNIPNSACVANFKLRFSSKSSNSFFEQEHMYVDDVKITGIPSIPVVPCQVHNVWGWAWAGAPQASGGEKLGLGWISFSCKNLDTGTDYGVDIDANPSSPTYGYFSGYAWSEYGGWVSFEQSDLAGCPSAPCRAWANTTNGQVYGWAKALASSDPQAGGWEGWIHLNGSNYGVNIDKSTSPAQFRGWAWGEDVMGWVSFNCANPESPNVCPQTDDYRVETSFSFGLPPTVSDLRIDQPPSYCTGVQKRGYVDLSWIYDGDTPQAEYRIQVSTNDAFSSLAIDKSIIQTVNPGDRGASRLTVWPSPTAGQLEIRYNTDYWVRVMVKDSDNVWSTTWSNVINFRTADHAYPWPDFSWTPADPAVGQVAQMLDASKCYDINNNEIACSRWNWTIPPGDIFVDGTSASSQNPHILILDAGDDSITLQVFDTEDNTCSITKNMGTKLPLPEWIEIMPR